MLGSSDFIPIQGDRLSLAPSSSLNLVLHLKFQEQQLQMQTHPPFPLDVHALHTPAQDNHFKEFENAV